MNAHNLTTRTHVIVAGLLSVAIVASIYGSDSALRGDIQELRAAVELFDAQWCDRINAMHRTRGFEPLDCDTGAIRMKEVMEWREQHGNR